MSCLAVISVVISVVVILITYFKWKFTYWEKLGLECIPPTIPFGNVQNFFYGRRSPGEQLREFYREIRARGLRHAGIYFGPKPFYFPVDPEIIKSIMVKDFQHFMNHGNYSNVNHDPLSGQLFNLEDEKWKDMRNKLTPTFTSGKMKMMFQTLIDTTIELKEVMDELIDKNQSFQTKDILARYGTDVIASCAFGIECNSLKDPDSEFHYYGKRITQNSFKEILYIVLQFMLPFRVLDIIKYKFTKPDVEKFIMRLLNETIEYREKNNIYRKDFMHSLIQLKNRGIVSDDGKLTDDEDKINKDGQLTFNEIAAQVYVFFQAGFETSSTLVSWSLYELAVNPEIQEKLRTEICEIIKKHNNQLTYEGMMEMSYLDKVLQETLRKYPPLAMMQRVCTKDYQIPGTDIILKRGTDIMFSNWGPQTDPEYYPDPDKFDPERFSEAEKNKRPACTFFPFGEGPRHCIGMRFALMQSKVAVITLLQNYKIRLSQKTQLPIKMESTGIFLTPVGGLWFDMSHLKSST